MSCRNADVRPCTKCDKALPPEAFYRQGRTRMGACKECHKVRVRENRAAKREQYSAYERERAQRPDRRAAQRAVARRHDPVKRRCRAATKRAVREGLLVRLPCEVCGDVNTEAHHEDYTKPLEVRWLCFRHHREAHGQVVVSDFIRPVAKPARAS